MPFGYWCFGIRYTCSVCLSCLYFANGALEQVKRLNHLSVISSRFLQMKNTYLKILQLQDPNCSAYTTLYHSMVHFSRWCKHPNKPWWLDQDSSIVDVRQIHETWVCPILALLCKNTCKLINRKNGLGTSKFKTRVYHCSYNSAINSAHLHSVFLPYTSIRVIVHACTGLPLFHKTHHQQQLKISQESTQTATQNFTRINTNCKSFFQATRSQMHSTLGHAIAKYAMKSLQKREPGNSGNKSLVTPCWKTTGSLELKFISNQRGYTSILGNI